MSGISNLDKVPVKIVEKYKIPPPLYSLPHTIRNKLITESKIFNEYYDSQLEHHVLASLTEWRRLRQEAKCLRQERIKKREQLFQQKVEEHQKQILEAISYPSTDDLSSSSDNEKDDNGDNSNAKYITNDSNSFYNILQPTVLSVKESHVELNATNANKKQMECWSDKKLEKPFNYRDFEADTSSPFDNIELKTINDLDVLAQVLHNTQITTQESRPIITTDRTNCVETSIEIRNSERDNNESDCDDNIPNELNHIIDMSSAKEIDNVMISKFPSFTSCNNGKNINQDNCENVKNEIVHSQLQCDTNSKSISVPNIVKELSDNLQIAALKRTRVKSINKMETNKQENITDENGDCEYFNQLDDMGRQLVKNICDMGFPRERVSRVALLLGFDDKKIIEHLIPCTELADIGFNESDISDALIRYDNNKEKALEDLIS